jgi:hypothetical protein
MRFQDYTILELALVVRDSKANPNAYDRDSRDALRRACQLRLRLQSLEDFQKRFEAEAERSLGQTAYAEVMAYAKPAGYTSGVWG